MNKLQKRLVVFLLILSLGLFLSTFKVAKVVIEKNEEIGKLSSKITDFTKKTQDLVAKVEDREKELDKVKLDVKDLSYEVEEEKKKVDSFQVKYKAEKKGRKGLAVVTEKLKEEKELLSRDLNETKLAKEAGEAFVPEGKGELTEEKPPTAESMVTPFITSGRIVIIYPQRLLGIELEKSPQDRIKLGKIVKGERETKISNIHSRMIILEAAEGEDLSGFKKNDVIKYVR